MSGAIFVVDVPGLDARGSQITTASVVRTGWRLRALTWAKEGSGKGRGEATAGEG